MVRQTIGYLGLLILVTFLGQQVLTTLALVRVDGGLRSSLQSTNQLAQAQQHLLQENASLHKLSAVTAQMNFPLKQALSIAAGIDAHIQNINQLNAQTLKINQSINGIVGQSGISLARVAEEMKQLNQVLQGVNKSLGQLDQYVGQDSGHLHAMADTVQSINGKLPGVNP